jgi:hypothetical protein
MVLRLLCVQSVTAGGIRTNKLDAIRRQIAQTYGYEHLYSVCNLEKAGWCCTFQLTRHIRFLMDFLCVGLIRRKDLMLVETTSVWQNLKRVLRLIDDRINVARPDDISYVSSGYAPLSVRLVQALGGTVCSWSGIVDALKLLPGPMHEITQLESATEELSEAIDRIKTETSHSSLALTSVVAAAAAAVGVSSAGYPASEALTYASYRERSDTKPIMLVFMIGGLSYLEVAAFRFLSKDPAFPYTILMATTKLINGDTFIRSLEYECVPSANTSVMLR